MSLHLVELGNGCWMLLVQKPTRIKQLILSPANMSESHEHFGVVLMSPAFDRHISQIWQLERVKIVT